MTDQYKYLETPEEAFKALLEQNKGGPVVEWLEDCQWSRVITPEAWKVVDVCQLKFRVPLPPVVTVGKQPECAMTTDTIKRTLRIEATRPQRPTVFNMHHASLNALDEYRLPKRLRWYIADEDTLRTYMLLVAEAL